MTINFMIGAIIGSGLAITLAGPPARRVMAVIQKRIKGRDRP